jgi:hypothetical protein
MFLKVLFSLDSIQIKFQMSLVSGSHIRSASQKWLLESASRPKDDDPTNKQAPCARARETKSERASERERERKCVCVFWFLAVVIRTIDFDVENDS